MSDTLQLSRHIQNSGKAIMWRDPLLAESIDRLVTKKPYDVILYLDERGTPAVDHRLITGGVLVYSEVDRVSADWRHFAERPQLRNRKGTDLSRKDLLDVASFVIGQPLLPVAVWSVLETMELNRLKAFEREYKRSNSPKKRFRKISAASWLLRHQITQTIALADVSFMAFVGPLGKASVYIDQVTDQQGMPELWQSILEANTSRKRLGALALASGVPPYFAKLLEKASAPQWQAHLNAKGPLAQLADFVCAMFGRYIDDGIREPWEVVRLRHAVGESRYIPPCMGGDVTWSVQMWLEELYMHGKPED